MSKILFGLKVFLSNTADFIDVWEIFLLSSSSIKMLSGTPKRMKSPSSKTYTESK